MKVSTPHLARVHHGITPVSTAALLSFLVGLVAPVSCTSTTFNDNHCFYNRGNETCAERYGTELPYCATGCAGTDGNPASPNEDGCVDWEPPASCYSPCGGEHDITQDNTCVDVAGTEATTAVTATMTSPTSTPTDPTTSDDADTTQAMTSDSGSETGPMVCLTSGGCTDPAAPICLDDVCRPCSEAGELATAECAAKNPDLPVCGASGTCVECTKSEMEQCENPTPVCGDEVCRECGAHPECQYLACDILIGECFPATCLRSVPRDNPTVQAALNALAGQPGSCMIYVTDDIVGADASYAIAINGGGPRAIVGTGPVPYRITASGAPTLSVIGGASVYIGGLRLSGNTSDLAIEISGAGTMLHIDASEIVGNAGGGVTVGTGAELRVRNSMVGGDVNDVDAVTITSGSADVLNSTLFAGFGTARALSCGIGGQATVRNSILMARTSTAAVSCADLDISYSALESAAAGAGNVNVGDVVNTWFTSVAGGNFHLGPSGATAFADIGRWTPGDPLVDIDGDPRVVVDQAMEHAGADVP